MEEKLELTWEDKQWKQIFAALPSLGPEDKATRCLVSAMQLQTVAVVKVLTRIADALELRALS